MVILGNPLKEVSRLVSV